MNEVTAGFVDGFLGAFKLAAALVVGITSGAYALFSRLSRQYTNREPLQ
jgi:predicted patatin/cPLA2 family phospholipase